MIVCRSLLRPIIGGIAHGVRIGVLIKMFLITDTGAYLADESGNRLTF